MLLSRARATPGVSASLLIKLTHVSMVQFVLIRRTHYIFTKYIHNRNTCRMPMVGTFNILNFILILKQTVPCLLI